MRSPLEAPLDPQTFPLVTLVPEHRDGGRVYLARSLWNGPTETKPLTRPTLEQIIGHARLLQGRCDQTQWRLWEIASSSSSFENLDELQSKVITLRFPLIGLCSLDSLRSFLSSIIWWLHSSPRHLVVITYEEEHPQYLLVLASLLMALDCAEGSLQSVLQLIETRDKVGDADFHWFARLLGQRGNLGFVPLENWLPSCARYATYIETLLTYNSKLGVESIPIKPFELIQVKLSGVSPSSRIEVYHRLPIPMVRGRIPDFSKFKLQEWKDLAADAASLDSCHQVFCDDVWICEVARRHSRSVKAHPEIYSSYLLSILGDLQALRKEHSPTGIASTFFLPMLSTQNESMPTGDTKWTKEEHGIFLCGDVSIIIYDPHTRDEEVHVANYSFNTSLLFSEFFEGSFVIESTEMDHLILKDGHMSSTFLPSTCPCLTLVLSCVPPPPTSSIIDLRPKYTDSTQTPACKSRPRVHVPPPSTLDVPNPISQSVRETEGIGHSSSRSPRTPGSARVVQYCFRESLIESVHVPSTPTNTRLLWWKILCLYRCLRTHLPTKVGASMEEFRKLDGATAHSSSSSSDEDCIPPHIHPLTPSFMQLVVAHETFPSSSTGDGDDGFHRSHASRGPFAALRKKRYKSLLHRRRSSASRSGNRRKITSRKIQSSVSVSQQSTTCDI
eukprot:Gregarina_sp_Poly_1__2561@NODE_1694_length_3526_cov_123_341717_g1112_i0_p1_GENE_NODE_1694_length_3526_cov_123_341717_g1112_i0NODE_1694_length_3526_cov_123_341717_g1112_i0_p1_ORF_typecomplete_len671_score65_25PTEN_C2/PF10409_9/0_25_NODE_1694_length_3526_cov_123_341717_g1112_i013583370